MKSRTYFAEITNQKAGKYLSERGKPESTSFSNARQNVRYYQIFTGTF